MSKVHSNYSENEDDPDVFESSGDEWKLEEVEQKNKNKRRSSQRLSKKPKLTHVDSSDSEVEAPKQKPKNGVNRKQKSTNNGKSINSTPVNKSNNSGNTFMTGNFLILKKDAQSGDPLKHPCIWKIDGKALLQKYEPFEDDGKIKHRNTSIYTGWSALDKDLYAPINVQVLSHAGQKMVVELNWDQIKDINNESD